MSSPRFPALLLLAVFLVSGANADDVKVPKGKAVKKSCSDGITADPGVFCDSVAECIRYCKCECTFDKHKWNADDRDDGSTTCPNIAADGEGMLPTRSTLLQPVPTNLAHISVPANTRAIQEVVDGLTRLSAHLETSANRARYNYTIRIGSCYRNHLVDTVPECGYVLKSAYMLDRTTDTEKRNYWIWTANPQHLGLAWPGRTPHSGGYACDLIMVDAGGHDCFDWRAGVKGSPACAAPLDPKTASALMDEEVTHPDVGGVRLRYEAWHYEWGPSATGCVHPDCAKNNWPLKGSP